jgi:hypothetical protein
MMSPGSVKVEGVVLWRCRVAAEEACSSDIGGGGRMIGSDREGEASRCNFGTGGGQQR